MNHVLSVIAIFAATVVLNAQDIGQAFAAKTFQDGDFALNYRIHVPENIPPGEKWVNKGEQASRLFGD